MPMETYIKENGKMEKQMELEFLLILMDPCMRVNGKMINNMDTAQNPGTITKSNSLENSQKAKKTGKGRFEFEGGYYEGDFVDG